MSVRTALAATLSTAVLAATLTVVSAPVAAAQPLRWGACPERVETPRAQCATVSVPMDYADVSGERIDLTVVRIPARGSSRGVLFGNSGGPGGDGLTYFDDQVPFTWPAALRDEWDLVAVQPRGLPDGTPLRCAPLDETDLVMLATNAGGAQRAACEATQPGYSRHITTENTARDWEEVRRALGTPRISIHGLSYGTLLGSTYATLFPQHTDRLVLDSGVDPEWMWNEVLGRQDPAYRDRFYAYLHWVADRDDRYGLGATPLAVYQRWSQQVASEAGVAPTIAPPPAQIGDVPPGLEIVAQQYIDGVTLTGPARVGFEGFVAQVMTGGATQLMSPTLGATRQLLPQSGAWPMLAETLAAGETLPGGDELMTDDVQVSMTMQSIQLCNENQVPPRPLDYPAFLWSSFVTGDLFSMIGPTFTSGAACAGAAPTTRPIPISGDRLATRPLLINSVADPQTPMAGARAMAARMGAHVIEVQGGDHGQVAKGNRVVDDAVIEYLRTGRTGVTTAPAPPIPGG